MSLKENLNKEIKERYPEAISFDKIIEIARYYKPFVKEKSVERVLNRSLSPDIVTLKNEKGHIKGYLYKAPEQATLNDYL